MSFSGSGYILFCIITGIYNRAPEHQITFVCRNMDIWKCPGDGYYIVRIREMQHRNVFKSMLVQLEANFRKGSVPLLSTNRNQHCVSAATDDCDRILAHSRLLSLCICRSSQTCNKLSWFQGMIRFLKLFVLLYHHCFTRDLLSR